MSVIHKRMTNVTRKSQKLLTKRKTDETAVIKILDSWHFNILYKGTCT